MRPASSSGCNTPNQVKSLDFFSIATRGRKQQNRRTHMSPAYELYFLLDVRRIPSKNILHADDARSTSRDF